MKIENIKKSIYELTRQYSWSFGNSYANYDSFVKTFVEKNMEICNIEVEDFEIESVNKIIIEFVGIEDDEYADLYLLIEFESGKTTFLELMYRFNQATIKEFEDADHKYFEGFQYKNYLSRELGLMLRTGS